MAATTTGLTNNGVTAHYAFTYDDSLGAPLNPGGPEPARTNAVIAAAEADYTLMAGWFANPALDVNLPIPVNVTPSGGGAAWGRSGANLTITIKPAAGPASLIRYLLIAEIVETLMRIQNAGWFGAGTEGSQGEGLSRFLAAQFWIINGFGNSPPGAGNANAWLNSPRNDFVNNIATGDDGPDAITGCSLLFIWYLFAQLGFTVNQIVAAGAPGLGGVYRNLTGDTADPFPFFKQLLDNAFPGTSTITTGNPDNPFPLGILSFWVDKSTFGVDEVTDLIATSGGSVPNTFWLVLEGFNINNFNALGIGAPVFSGAFKNLPGLTIAPDPAGVQFEIPANTRIPQRIRFPFDVTFTNATLSSFPAAGANPVQEPLHAVMNVGATPLPGAAADTEFELVSGADPYFTNINPVANNDFWLSQEIRVFTTCPGLNGTPVAGAPAFPSDSFAGAYTYIQGVLGFLNDPANHFSDGTNDPFTNGTIPNQAGALSGDSSVFRFTLRPFPFQLLNNYNFAVARVRLRGPALSQAPNLKVFFRVWQAPSPDSGFDPNSAYLSHLDVGHPHWPLPAPDSHTLPFFATSNTPNFTDPNNVEFGTNGVNNRTVVVPAGQHTVWAYFGCFLNVYDPANVVNGMQVQAILAGDHHCVVGQIAYDDAPIVNANGIVASPENSDKLAQRNLQFSFSDNPGPADTHRVPQTFDLKPGTAVTTTPGNFLEYPDELMIDWGDTPPGSIAHIYWPAVNAFEVLTAANNIYGTHLLSASDANTIDCKVVKGVTYVPIPSSTTQNIAGLFTVDVPLTVTVGQEFNIIVRRISTRRVLPEVIPEAPRIFAEIGAATSTPAVAPPKRATTNWRYVVGTFQITIAATTSDIMLRPDEDTLAVMKWRLLKRTPADRWYPVLQRYIAYLSARIEGLGGDPEAIPPSPDGAPVDEATGAGLIAYCGKVIEVFYDCSGEFEGFALGDCCDEVRVFKSCERGVGKVALRACKEDLVLTVFVERGREDCIRKLALSESCASHPYHQTRTVKPESGPYGRKRRPHEHEHEHGLGGWIHRVLGGKPEHDECEREDSDERKDADERKHREERGREE